MEKEVCGLKLSPIDLRDYRFDKHKVRGTYPGSYQLEKKTKVKNQDLVSSCGAHALSTILEYHNGGKTTLSTNFIYGIRNRLYKSEGEGMTLKECCKIALDYGDMILSDCPGNTEVDAVFSIASKAFDDQEKLDRASSYKIKKYTKLLSTSDIKYAIMNHGPVIGCVLWYDNARYNNKTGFIEFNKKNDYGGHAVVIYGWDKDGWLCQNSWGTLWGNKGYYKLKYADGPAEAYCLIDDETIGNDVINPTHNSKLLNNALKAVSKLLNKFKKKK